MYGTVSLDEWVVLGWWEGRQAIRRKVCMQLSKTCFSDYLLSRDNWTNIL
jgi:hypothetical protein